MTTFRLLPAAFLVMSSLLSLSAEARVLAFVKCGAQTDGGIGIDSANCVNNVGGAYSTSASADLATGELGSFTSVNDQTQINSTADIEDLVTINGIAPLGTADIPFSMNVTGVVSGILRDDFAFARAVVRAVNPGTSSVNIAFVSFFFDGVAVTTDTTNSTGDFDLVVNSLTDNNINVTLTATASASFADPSLTLAAQLVTWPWVTSNLQLGISNFGSTGRFSIDVPEGLSYTSESGVFLTQAIPVPAAMWLFGSALGLLGWMRRKKA